MGSDVTDEERLAVTRELRLPLLEYAAKWTPGDLPAETRTLLDALVLTRRDLTAATERIESLWHERGELLRAAKREAERADRLERECGALKKRVDGISAIAAGSIAALMPQVTEECDLLERAEKAEAALAEMRERVRDMLTDIKRDVHMLKREPDHPNEGGATILVSAVDRILSVCVALLRRAQLEGDSDT